MIIVKMFTRQVGRLEKEIYLTPAKVVNGKPVCAGRIVSSDTVDGKRVLTMELDDRNSKRFSEFLLTDENKDNYKVTEWVESHFEVWHHRRLQLRVNAR